MNLLLPQDSGSPPRSHLKVYVSIGRYYARLAAGRGCKRRPGRRDQFE